MSQLRELLADLIGAEVQSHPVTINGKAKALHFRQFDDATGRRIFATVQDETTEARGLRIMREVIAASVCTPDGALIGTPEDVQGLPMGALEPLYQAAASTNGLTPAVGSEPGTGGDNADPADEAESPNG